MGSPGPDSVSSAVYATLPSPLLTQRPLEQGYALLIHGTPGPKNWKTLTLTILEVCLEPPPLGSLPRCPALEE